MSESFIGSYVRRCAIEAGLGLLSAAVLAAGWVVIDLGAFGGSLRVVADMSRPSDTIEYGEANRTGLSISPALPSVGVNLSLYNDDVTNDLNVLPQTAAAGWTLTSAYVIDDSGQIIGFGEIGGKKRVFTATPAVKSATHYDDKPQQYGWHSQQDDRYAVRRLGHPSDTNTNGVVTF